MHGSFARVTRGNQSASRDRSDLLAETLILDIADWWAPSTQNYPEAVPKATIAGAVTEAHSSDAALDLGAMGGCDKGGTTAIVRHALAASAVASLRPVPMCRSGTASSREELSIAVRDAASTGALKPAQSESASALVRQSAREAALGTAFEGGRIAHARCLPTEVG